MKLNDLPTFYKQLDSHFCLKNTNLKNATYTNVDSNFVKSSNYPKHRWFNYKEGFTINGKPRGKGKSFWPNGNVYQDGRFNVKGLVNGKEYFSNGKLRFDGIYKINKAYGPNYPIEGKCYDKDGNLYYEGKLELTAGGVGYPIVTKPAEFGPVAQSDKPNIDYFMWEDERKQ